MNRRPIIDAGPGINFLAVNKERLLISVLGPLCAPEAVETEVLRKSRRDPRFSGVQGIWTKLTPNYLEILSDDVTAELATAVQRISGVPFGQRIRSGKDLGETMVVAHAVVAAEAGERVIVLIDDGDGCRAAASEARRLRRLLASGSRVGSIELVHTATVLERAAGKVFLPDKKALRELYGRLRGLDDGLLPLESTDLLNLPCWQQS